MAYVSGRVYGGQKTGITTSASVLHPTQACREVLIQNDAANTGNLVIGNSTDQYVALTPGQSITLPIVSLNLLFVKMSIGTGVANWIARD